MNPNPNTPAEVIPPTMRRQVNSAAAGASPPPAAARLPYFQPAGAVIAAVVRGIERPSE